MPLPERIRSSSTVTSRPLATSGAAMKSGRMVKPRPETAAALAAIGLFTSIGPDTVTLTESSPSPLKRQLASERPLVSTMQGMLERSCGRVGVPFFAISSGDAQSLTEKGPRRRAISEEFSSREMRTATSKP